MYSNLSYLTIFSCFTSDFSKLLFSTSYVTFAEDGATARTSHQDCQPAPTPTAEDSGLDTSAEDSLLHVHLGGGMKYQSVYISCGSG